MGIKENIIKENSYKDSVFLMEIARKLEKTEGVKSASLMMGTAANKEILFESGLLTDKGKAASENDLIIAIHADGREIFNDALQYIQDSFDNAGSGTDKESSLKPASFEAALKTLDNPNFALISVAGEYAAREAGRALEKGLNVMIFSDNVSLEDEIRLKRKSAQKDLLMMGPDCGTAIIGGVPLGFANRVPAGNIGIVAASGSGLQEVTVVISKEGAGITHALGTGGRDLSKEVGGVTMNAGLDVLKEDQNTEVVVLLSKPPHPEVAEKLIAKAKNINKPVVICFLGSKNFKSEANIHFTSTLEGAAIAAAQISRGEKVSLPEFTLDNIDSMVDEDIKKISSGEKYIRGLYAGGTLCDETIDIMKNMGIFPYSNTGVEEENKLADSNKSREHCLVDMGEDEFTKGRPHPMIDLSLRNRRIEKEASDPETAVILFDLVLGYGANPDPAGEMEDTLNNIEGKKLLIASVCGTDSDPQNYSRQISKLTRCGVRVLPTNAQAARYACKIIKDI
ncbi:MAG: acyl-CoA synthetase FdrA [Elusimicrobiota bacterium]|nr:acyl-CoA synthetase FdrA [Elusimicrobiota bacterium]